MLFWLLFVITIIVRQSHTCRGLEANAVAHARSYLWCESAKERIQWHNAVHDAAEKQKCQHQVVSSHAWQVIVCAQPRVCWYVFHVWCFRCTVLRCWFTAWWLVSKRAQTCWDQANADVCSTDSHPAAGATQALHQMSKLCTSSTRSAEPLLNVSLQHALRLVAGISQNNKGFEPKDLSTLSCLYSLLT